MTKTIGFIDYFLDEFHANAYPEWIEQASGGAVKVAYAFALTDKEDGLSNTEWCRRHNVQWIDSIEEVVRLSDYLIVLSPDDPEHHESLSQLPLRLGKPTYIDKTFAPDRETALRLFELAERHGTPMFSTSALRYATEFAGVRKDGIEAVASWGPGRFANYGIHQIEPVVTLMGSDPKRVKFIGTANAPALLIDFGGGRQASIHHFGGDCPFMMAVQQESGTSQILKVESNFFGTFIEKLVEFFRTGRPPVERAETVAVVTIIEYGIKAAAVPHRWVDLPQG
ncbi:hypothetical protein [Paenibacillus sp.]|uniref:hypothetical protein n=1 Tax=Paenibacillus sp. TaxID=58172 RepID=UPI002811ABC5|nr:hypothetical protein [Paenibacillus sp.]